MIQRWVKRKQQYFHALRDTIGFQASATLDETISRYIAHRIYSISVTPLFTFIEYACSLHLPNYVFEQEAMLELERVAVELQMLGNDCVSYHRERALGCEHNIVHWFRHHGLTEQEAYDRVHELMRERYRSWYLALAELPIWGEEIDRQVQRYIKGMQDVALANAHWRYVCLDFEGSFLIYSSSFRSERYFGKYNAEVRRTMRIIVGQSDWLESVILKASAVVVEVVMDDKSRTASDVVETAKGSTEVGVVISTTEV